MRRASPAAVAAIAMTAALAACAPAENVTIDRPVVDKARGVRYVVPPGWKSFEGEIRSLRGSLLEVKVFDLEGADHRFIEGLPDSIFPQLADWAKYYFIVEGPGERSQTTVAGLPAAELSYPIRIRPRDPLSKVTYWIVRREKRLFVLRTAYAPNALVADEPAVRKIVAGWQLLETPAASPSPSGLASSAGSS